MPVPLGRRTSTYEGIRCHERARRIFLRLQRVTAGSTFFCYEQLLSLLTHAICSLIPSEAWKNTPLRRLLARGLPYETASGLRAATLGPNGANCNTGVPAFLQLELSLCGITRSPSPQRIETAFNSSMLSVRASLSGPADSLPRGLHSWHTSCLTEQDQPRRRTWHSSASRSTEGSRHIQGSRQHAEEETTQGLLLKASLLFPMSEEVPPCSTRRP